MYKQQKKVVGCWIAGTALGMFSAPIIFGHLPLWLAIILGFSWGGFWSLVGILAGNYWVYKSHS
jgi:hypothetical protein